MTANGVQRFRYGLTLIIGALIGTPVGIFLWQNYDQDISVTVHSLATPGAYVADISSEHHELCINSINVVVLAYGVWPTFPTPNVFVDSFQECRMQTKSQRARVPINMNGYDPTTVRPGRVCVDIFYSELNSRDDRFHTKISCE